MKIFHALLASLLLTSCSPLQPPNQSSPSAHQSDPSSAIAKLVQDRLQADPDLVVSVVTDDFNCDGIMDCAITDSNLGGTGGSLWTLYLRKPADAFVELGTLTTKSARFRVTKKTYGVGDVAVMQRGGPGNLNIGFYEVSFSGLKHLRSEAVHLTEELQPHTRIDEVFGRDYSEHPSTQYTGFPPRIFPK